MVSSNVSPKAFSPPPSPIVPPSFHSGKQADSSSATALETKIYRSDKAGFVILCPVKVNFDAPSLYFQETIESLPPTFPGSGKGRRISPAPFSPARKGASSRSRTFQPAPDDLAANISPILLPKMVLPERFYRSVGQSGSEIFPARPFPAQNGPNSFLLPIPLPKIVLILSFYLTLCQRWP